jgi:phospholipid transport system substrate-binding protein
MKIIKTLNLFVVILLLALTNANNAFAAAGQEDDASDDGTSSVTDKFNTKTTARTKATVVAISDCTTGPCKVVFDTTKQVMDSVNNDDDSEEILAIISPKFDFQLMTKFAMGTNWKLATKTQQDRLVVLFRQLLTYTYSNAWSKFKGAKITLMNTKIINAKDGSLNKQRAIVVSNVLLSNSADNQPIKVEYDLAHTGVNNTWVAYDIKIADASLVTTYRNQFNNIILGSKVDGLIAQLQTKVTNLKKHK